jgi:hypothetical protein
LQWRPSSRPGLYGVLPCLLKPPIPTLAKLRITAAHNPKILASRNACSTLCPCASSLGRRRLLVLNVPCFTLAPLAVLRLGTNCVRAEKVPTAQQRSGSPAAMGSAPPGNSGESAGVPGQNPRNLEINDKFSFFGSSERRRAATGQIVWKADGAVVRVRFDRGRLIEAGGVEEPIPPAVLGNPVPSRAALDGPRSPRPGPSCARLANSRSNRPTRQVTRPRRSASHAPSQEGSDCGGPSGRPTVLLPAMASRALRRSRPPSRIGLTLDP